MVLTPWARREIRPCVSPMASKLLPPSTMSTSTTTPSPSSSGSRFTCPMPAQDEHLPHRIEAHVHAAGLEAQRCLFRALMEKADHQVVLDIRDGDQGQGIQ